MRVLLLAPEYPPLGTDLAHAAESLARGLAARGLTVDVVAGGGRQEPRREQLWNGRTPDEGLLTVYSVECQTGGTMAYARTALPLLRRRLREERYDLLHLFYSLPVGALLPLLDLREVPVVMTLDGTDVPAPRWSGRISRWLWRHADRIVVPRESLGLEARRAWPELRYGVIPEGIDIARFHPAMRRRPGRRLRCLSVAPLELRSRLADLIRAVAMLEHGRVELEIIGAGREAAALRELASGLEIRDRVVFSGPVNRNTRALRYREADLFVLPGREAHTRCALAEAMACGLPLVGTNLDDISELVRHGGNGLLVPAGNPLALAAAIRHLGDRPDLRAEMGRRNRQEAEAGLSWDRISARYISTYQGLRRRVPARSGLAELPSSTW